MTAKLSREVLPYLATSYGLPRLWFCRTALVFSFATDVLAVLAFLGAAPPSIVALLQTSSLSAAKAAPPGADVPALLAPIPAKFRYPVLAVIGVWVLLRVLFYRGDWPKRAVLATSCRRMFKQIEARLHSVLTQPNPMPEIVKLMVEQVQPMVDRNIQEGAWPWPGPNLKADAKAKELLATFCERYEKGWTPVDRQGYAPT
ncbi:MAG TPA: hypothetical protein VHO06_04210 [Polyangia bacterium]|nr:hypothetical protein [Polyangia bacterium]